VSAVPGSPVGRRQGWRGRSGPRPPGGRPGCWAPSRPEAHSALDLVLYGHGSLAQALREHGLIDEFRFAIHPVLAGCGQLLFQAGGKTPLTLVTAETLSTGIVVLSYQPASA
jgi:dihydrofolate reductase